MVLATAAEGMRDPHAWYEKRGACRKSMRAGGRAQSPRPSSALPLPFAPSGAKKPGTEATR